MSLRFPEHCCFESGRKAQQNRMPIPAQKVEVFASLLARNCHRYFKILSLALQHRLNIRLAKIQAEKFEAKHFQTFSKDRPSGRYEVCGSFQVNPVLAQGIRASSRENSSRSHHKLSSLKA